MRQGFTRILIGLSGVVLTICAIVVLVQVWANFPPSDIVALERAFWAMHFLPGTFHGDAAIWIWHYLIMLAGAWPLALVIPLGVLGTWLVLMYHGSEELAAYLERVYTLEQQSTQTKNREDALLARWDGLSDGLDTLFEQSGELWLVVTPEGRVRRWNRAALEFVKRFHPSMEQLEGQLLGDLWKAYGASPLAKAVLDAGRARKVWHGDLQVAAEGLHLQVWVLPFGDEIALWMRDVSLRYQPEATLRSSEALVRQLVEDSIRPVAVLDTQWRYLYVSRRWNELFKLDMAMPLVGVPHARVLPNFPPNLTQVSQALAMGQAVGKDDEKVVIGGREEVIGWGIRPWRDADNRLGGFIFTAVPNTELSRLRAQVQQSQERENALAYADSLTGLPNRQLFNDRLNMALALGYRQLSKVALMFIDLDGFKAVNDTLGHDYGDMLLKQVGERLKTVTRDTDTVARLGGDEFTVILNVRERGDVELVAQKVLEALGKPFDLAGKEGKIGASIGIAMYPQDGNTAGDLIKKADAAMYEAKTGGKNAYRFATKILVIAE